MPDAALSNRERAEQLVAKVLETDAAYEQACNEQEEAIAHCEYASRRVEETREAMLAARREAAEVMGLD